MKNNNYIKKDNIIYKYIVAQKIWVQMTNIKRGVDRRFNKDIFNNNKQYRYPISKAREEINSYWNSYKDEWVYCGKTYNNSHPIASYNIIKDCANSSVEYKVWFIIEDVVNNAVHSFIHKYTKSTGEECIYKTNYYLVWHQGNIYWMTTYHYLPQCQLYKFESIDKEPSKIIKWTHIKNVKVVWNKTNKCYA